MKRISLLGSKPTRAPQLGFAWSELLVEAARVGQHDTLIDLINVPGGRVALRAQFSSGGFAGMCLDIGAIDALYAVVQAAPDGVTLRDTCTYHVIDPSPGGRPALEISSEIDLHVNALAADPPNPQALALALRYEPASSCISEPLQRFHGATLHCRALEIATWAASAATAEPAADCCRLLLAHGAPIGANSAQTSNIHAALTTLFFCTRWDRQGAASPMVALIKTYLDAGLWALDGRDSKGHSPLESAVTTGNGYAAAALIDLGCDLTLPSFPEHANDLLALADAWALLDGTRTCKPLVAQALMRRRMNQADLTTSGAVGATAPRARRMGI